MHSLLRRLRGIWELAKREHASPREIGWAVGLGVFVGCSPWVGFHAWIAVGLATLLRLNRLWAFLGSRISALVFLVWIAFVEVQLAHRVRTGAWAPVHVATVLDEGRMLLVDWVLGSLVVGIVLGLVVGVLVYAVAQRRPSRRAPLTADLAASSDHAP